MHHPLTAAAPPAVSAEAAEEEETRKRRVVAMRSALNLPCVLAPSLTGEAAERLASLMPHLLTALAAAALPGADDASTEEATSTAAASTTAAATPAAAAGVGDTRRLCARAIATCCDALGCGATEQALDAILASLRPTAAAPAQRGAALCLSALVEVQQARVLPYAALLIAPLVACLSSGDGAIRSVGAGAFGRLMPLLPLEPGTPDPPDMPAALAARKAAERPFVDQLLGLAGAKPPRYEMPVAVDAALRPYQQAGVDWLAFLRRFGLNGVLCDDMGLGKTLQALCVLAAAAHDRREAAASAASAAAAVGAAAAGRLPSLVVCPSTLTGHWIAEAAKFCGERLHAVAYVGNAAARARLLPSLPSFELVVMSYEHLRSDIQQLEGVRWDYVVLDEGHVIRNAKSKLAQAAKRLSSCRRLILSGTPLQNHAVELWSLFDFLMPGYLGTQAGFQASYARPIHASMGARAGEAAQLEGEAALARLHRQVLPFCLRRTKESVLSELPAKIIEDRLVELHPVQRKLYAAYTAASAPSDVVRAIDGARRRRRRRRRAAATAAAAAAAPAASASSPRSVPTQGV